MKEKSMDALSIFAPSRPSFAIVSLLPPFFFFLFVATPLRFLLLDFLCVYCSIWLRFLLLHLVRFAARCLMYLLLDLATIFSAQFGHDFCCSIWLGFLNIIDESYDKLGFLCNKCPRWIKLMSFWEIDEFFLAISLYLIMWYVLLLYCYI